MHLTGRAIALWYRFVTRTDVKMRLRTALIALAAFCAVTGMLLLNIRMKVPFASMYS